MDLRRVGPEERITGALLHDFLLSALRHDAIHDAVIERMAFFADCGQLDAEGLAYVLPELVGELLAVVDKADWIILAEVLIDAYRDAESGGEVAR